MTNIQDERDRTMHIVMAIRSLKELRKLYKVALEMVLEEVKEDIALHKRDR
jgi:hypothetical protein